MDTTLELPVSNRRFGIELEFTIPCGCSGVEDANCVGRYGGYHFDLETRQDRLFQRLFPLAPDRFISTGYDHSRGDVWHLKTDSSCGLELASPVLTWADWPLFVSIAEELVHQGAVVTPQCGVHVHHEVADFTDVQLRRLLLLWAAYEQGLLAVVEPTRINNDFCRLLRSEYPDFNQLLKEVVPLGKLRGFVQTMGKYRSLNCLNWWRNGTVEVRLYHGTLDASVIRFWVLLTQRLVEMSKQDRDFEAMRALFNDPANLQLQKLMRRMTQAGETGLNMFMASSVKKFHPRMEV